MEYNTLKIKDMPLSERPREKLLKNGASSLSNAELLALIINCGSRKESAVELASRLLASENDSVRAFVDYQPDEFCRHYGIGESAACRILAAIEFGRRAERPSEKNVILADPNSVAAYCSDLKSQKKEILRVLMFNVKCELIKAQDVSVGNLNSSDASPREIFYDAIRKCAYGIILVHNHPSGDPLPSESDKAATSRVCNAGKLLNIRVFDHIIVAERGYFSFKEKNMINDY